MYRYYYSKLPKRQQVLCDDIVRKISNFENIIDIYDPLITPQHIFDIFAVIDKDFPELFYLDIKSNAVEISMIAIRKRIKVNFTYPISMIKDYCSRLDKITSSLKLASQNCCSIEEKLNMVYDSVVRKVKYNYSTISHLDYTIIGPIFNHLGVCEGYAKTVKYFCDAVDINCLIISGNAYNTSNGINEGHAWNIITLDNVVFSHADATWDSIRYDKNISDLYYYLISDNKIGHDHTWERAIVPKCDGAFKEVVLPHLNSKAEIEVYLITTAKERKNKASFISSIKFKSTNEIVDMIYHIFSMHSNCKVKQYQVIYNATSNIVECSFEYY